MADRRYDLRVLVPAALLTVVTVVVAGVALVGQPAGAPTALPTSPALPSLHATPTPEPAASPTPRSRDSWREIVQRLSARRAAAFRAGDLPALRRVYAPHSAAGRRDIALLHSLVDKRLHVTGLHATVHSAVLRHRGAQRVMLLVVDALSAYRLRGPAGEPMGRRSAASGRWWLTLVETGTGWQVWDVAAVRGAVVSR